MKVDLTYLQNVKCSVCGKKDEGVYVSFYTDKADVAHVDIGISICEGCWAAKFKEFKKDK